MHIIEGCNYVDVLGERCLRLICVSVLKRPLNKAVSLIRAVGTNVSVVLQGSPISRTKWPRMGSLSRADSVDR